MTLPIRVLLLPGLANSGAEHWQSCWERADPSCRRVMQHEWHAPERADWVAALDAAVATHGTGVVLVGHSTACALIAFWAASATRGVRGALLVAPSDTEASSYPAGPTGWQPMPLAQLPFPSIVVASSDDDYCTLQRARRFADAWGSRFVDIGAAGHINSASGLGAWAKGRELLAELLAQPDAAK